MWLTVGTIGAGIDSLCRACQLNPENHLSVQNFVRIFGIHLRVSVDGRICERLTCGLEYPECRSSGTRDVPRDSGEAAS